MINGFDPYREAVLIEAKTKGLVLEGVSITSSWLSSLGRETVRYFVKVRPPFQPWKNGEGDTFKSAVLDALAQVELCR